MPAKDTGTTECSELGICKGRIKRLGERLISGNKTPFRACRRQRPTTGNIDFMAARKAFKRAQRHVVKTSVDKAANCLCVMCIACYKRAAMAELNGPAYERVGESLETIMEDITERQLKYLNLEYLPIPRVNAKIPNSHEYSLEPTEKQPVRYLMPKLHEQLPAFRGVTACCGTTTEGIAKVVNAVLVAIRPVLNAFWREECIRIGITDECWITSGSTEIVEVMRGMDRKATTPGEESLPHHLETFDFVAMYNQYPCHLLSKTCYERIIGTGIHVRRNKIRVEVFVR